ncbi:hypothetical protein AGMMS49957_12120 [Synergistales bacterium]|nr:hypothetical protein AGMMS49957_12120 [Synergistales bacterium]
MPAFADRLMAGASQASGGSVAKGARFGRGVRGRDGGAMRVETQHMKNNSKGLNKYVEGTF